MSEWKKVKLGEIASDIQTGPFGSQLHQSDYSESGIPVVMPKDLVNGRISEQSIARVSSRHAERLQKHKIAPGDILYSRRGDVGRCSFAFEKNAGWLCGTGCLRVSIDRSKAIPKFVFYELQLDESKGWVANHAVGSTMPNLNTKILSNIPVCIADLETQDKICDILSAYDDLIENNNRQIKLLEEAAQRLYKEWFVDLHFPGYEDCKIVDGVPEGWKREPLGAIFDVVRGKSYSSKELSDKDGQLMVNLSNIRPFGGYIRNQEKHFTGKYKGEQVVSSHNLVMGVTDMTQERRTVGRVALIPKLHSKAIISMDLIKLCPHNEFSLFYYALFKYGGYSELVSRFANGTNVLHLRPEVLDLVDAILPNETLQFRYNEFVKEIQNRIDAMQDQIILAEEARDRLLPKLMSGEIEV